jgi:hypothetical protein
VLLILMSSAGANSDGGAHTLQLMYHKANHQAFAEL